MPDVDRVVAGGSRVAPRVEAGREPPPDWAAALTPADGFADPAWLAVFAGRAPDERWWFALRGQGGAIAVGSAGHLQDRPIDYAPLDGALLSPGTSPLWPQGAPRSRSSGALPLPCLWLVHPGLASFVVGPERHRSPAVSALVEGIAGWAWQRGAAAVLWPYVSATDAVLSTALGQAGFAEVPLTAEAWLSVPSEGWSGYLAALPAAQRRHVERERRRLTDAGAVTRDGGEADLARCAELRAAHRRKYGLPADATGELDRLRTLTGLADHHLVIVDSTARVTPVSFCLFCRVGADWHAMATGTDETDPAGRFAYFEVCFYGAVEAAARAGVQRIAYGHAASAAKRRRGCDVQTVTAWVLARDPAVHRQLVELGGEWRRAHGRGREGAA